jgi:hypothetical protein
MHHRIFSSLYILFIILFSGIASCKKAVKAKVSDTELTGSLIFESDATATAAMLGVYSNINSGASFGNGNITLYCGLTSDEFTSYSVTTGQQEFFNNNILPTNQEVQSTWSQLYFTLYQANAVIEGVQGSEKISSDVKDQLTGEAKFMRAFCYYYLVQFFGAVPMTTTTDYHENSIKQESSKDEIYQQAVADLKDAVSLLPDNSSVSNGERTRPNKYAAEALLARIYLFLHAWELAEQAATDVIESGNFSLATSLDEVFLKNSPEALWQLRPVEPGINTREGSLFIVSGNPSDVILNSDFVNDFENEDLRRSHWIGEDSSDIGHYYYPLKYKVKYSSDITEYYSVFRLAELFLIRAEARTQLGQLSGAGGSLEDLNLIRSRAGLSPINSNDVSAVQAAIMQERKSELFAEWGHRWFDLKRSGLANTVLSPIKGASWRVTDTLFPKPASEILINDHLEQNEGYEN